MDHSLNIWNLTSDRICKLYSKVNSCNKVNRGTHIFLFFNINIAHSFKYLINLGWESEIWFYIFTRVSHERNWSIIINSTIIHINFFERKRDHVDTEQESHAPSVWKINSGITNQLVKAKLVVKSISSTSHYTEAQQCWFH